MINPISTIKAKLAGDSKPGWLKQLHNNIDSKKTIETVFGFTTLIHDILIVICVENKFLIYCDEPSIDAYAIPWDSRTYGDKWEDHHDTFIPCPLDRNSMGYLVYSAFSHQNMDNRSFNFDELDYLDALRTYYIDQYPHCKARLEHTKIGGMIENPLKPLLEKQHLEEQISEPKELATRKTKI